LLRCFSDGSNGGSRNESNSGLKKKLSKKQGFLRLEPIEEKEAQVLIKSFFVSCQYLERQYPQNIKTEIKQIAGG